MLDQLISLSTSFFRSSLRFHWSLKWVIWALFLFTCLVSSVGHLLLVCQQTFHSWLELVLESTVCWWVTYRIFIWWASSRYSCFDDFQFYSQNFSTISHRTHRIIFVTVLSTSDVIYAIIHCLENREPQIAVRSHIAGALSGILLGFIFYENHRQESRDVGLKFKILKRTSMVLYLCFVSLIILFNVMWSFVKELKSLKLSSIRVNKKLQNKILLRILN